MNNVPIHEILAITIIVIDWLIRVTAILVVPRNRRPNSAIAWLMLIFILPTAGMAAFLLIGNPKLPRHRRDAQRILDEAISKVMRKLESNNKGEQLIGVEPPIKYRNQAILNEALSHLPVCSGNQLDAITAYDGAITRMIRDIDAAEHFVYVEYFIMCLDIDTTPFFDALARAVKRGVTVRVLYDDFSTRRYPGWRRMLQFFRNENIEAIGMLPLRLPGMGYVRPDLRNHRKIVIIDGRVGYTGSQNLITRYYHRKDNLYYDELVMRIEGPGAVQLAAVFMTDWHMETGTLPDMRQFNKRLLLQRAGNSDLQILPSGPGYDDENNLKLFTSLLYQAQSSVTIVNPYFVPDEALSMALICAARRGVIVTIVNSEAMDQWMVGHAQRSFYEEMLRVGVAIYLYKSPILLHSKFMIVDNDAAVVGSSNMDIRSFLLDLEVSLVLYDPTVVKRLKKVSASYIGRSKRIDLHEWRLRPFRKVLLDNIARLTSALQ